MQERELIPMQEAARRLGISRMTMSRLAKQGRFVIYENPLDRREKLVDAAEVGEAVRPRPIRTGQEPEGKAAA